jgi:hypothetical protein
MKFSIIFLAILFSLPINSQTRIIGRLLEYSSNEPINYCQVRIDSTILKFENYQKDNVIQTNDSGYFQISYNFNSTKIDILFSAITYEKLIIVNIPNCQDSVINLGNIWLFEGSYNWDGECVTKYLWGLIKIKKGCGGYIKGTIEKSKGASGIWEKYPKNSIEKYFLINDRYLILDYNELIK